MQQPTLNVQNGFKILYYNARSILPKFEELRLICASENPDIVCLVETWLDGDIDDSELGIPSYSVIRLDHNRHCGGVALFLRGSLCHKVVSRCILLTSIIFVDLVFMSSPHVLTECSTVPQLGNSDHL